MSGPETSACQGLLEDAAVALLTREPLPVEVLEHLRACPACRDEVEAMAQLPGRLALARDVELAAPVEPSPLLLPRLLREVRRRRSQRLWLTAGAAAAAAAIAVGATIGIDLAREGSGQLAAARPSPVPSSSPSRPGAPGPSGAPGPGGPSDPGSGGASGPGASTAVEPVFSTGAGRDTVTGARAEVTVLAADWGSHVEIEVYDVPAHTTCLLVVVDRHGTRYQAGSWTVPPRGYQADGVTFRETVASRPQDVAQVLLVDSRSQRQMMQITVLKA